MKKITLLFLIMVQAPPCWAGILPTYTSLRDASIGKTVIFLNEVQSILKKTSDTRFSQVVSRKDDTPTCKSSNQWTCHPGIYGFNRCIKNQDTAIFSCPRPLTANTIRRYFTEPEFHRASWNSLLIQVTTLCEKRYTNTCKQLLKLKTQFLQAKKMSANKKKSK